MSATELNKKIDYNKTKIDDRRVIVDDILKDRYFEDYFDERFKVNLNSGDNLSEHDANCNSLERLANYLLNSDEVKEDKKSDDFEYKFYSDEEAFNKAVNKEPKIDGMGSTADKENVIHFLKKENRNFKKSKDQVISKHDLARNDELGQILREYTEYLEKITHELNNFGDSKLSRFKLSEISGSITNDMINAKDMLLGVFGYKTNAEESTVIDWEQVDFTNHDHARALLYMKPGKRSDEDLMFLIDDFIELIKLAKPTDLQKEIIELMRDNKGPTEIGNELNIPKQNVDKNIKMIVKRICKAAKRG
jgi:hypothetical protein